MIFEAAKAGGAEYVATVESRLVFALRSELLEGSVVFWMEDIVVLKAGGGKAAITFVFSVPGRGMK